MGGERGKEEEREGREREGNRKGKGRGRGQKDGGETVQTVFFGKTHRLATIHTLQTDGQADTTQ